jgi:hypothetical protein
MSAWEKLRREAKTVLFAGTALLAIVIMWAALHWSYRAVLSDKDFQLATLERRLSEYRDSLSGATSEEVKRRIETLETELKTIASPGLSGHVRSI